MATTTPQPTLSEDDLTHDELASVYARLAGAFSVVAPGEYAEALAHALASVDASRARAADPTREDRP